MFLGIFNRGSSGSHIRSLFLTLLWGGIEVDIYACSLNRLNQIKTLQIIA